MTKSTTKGLSAAERETVTVRTDDSEYTIIETTIRRDIGRLRRHPRFQEVDSGFFGSTEWAKFRIRSEDWSPASGAKRASTPMSDEQRAALGERLKAARAQ